MFSTKRMLYLCLCSTLLAGSLTTAHAADGSQLYLSKACAGCHGLDGRTPVTPMYPKVAGQNAAYTYNQLRDLKNGSRNNAQSAVMLGIMTAVSEEEMRAIADWLSTQ